MNNQQNYKQIILLGSDNLLGEEFIKYFMTKKQKIKKIKQSDFTNFTIEEVFSKLKLLLNKKDNLIINCIGFFGVYEAESQKDEVIRLNSNFIFYLSVFCSKYNIDLLIFSSAYIFSGLKQKKYKEEDKRDSCYVYGNSKILAEKWVEILLKKYYIIRTAWLYNNEGRGFPEKIIDILKKNKEIKITKNQIITPTNMEELINQINIIIDEKKYGKYNITNKGQISWYRLILKLKRIFNFKIKIIKNTEKKLSFVLENKNIELLKINIMSEWEKIFFEAVKKLE